MYKLSEGRQTLALVLSATAGNLAGSLITYAMGRGGNLVLHRHWLVMVDRVLGRAQAWFR